MVRLGLEFGLGVKVRVRFKVGLGLLRVGGG
jgi:hypothetical protein